MQHSFDPFANIHFEKMELFIYKWRMSAVRNAVKSKLILVRTQFCEDSCYDTLENLTTFKFRLGFNMSYVYVFLNTQIFNEILKVDKMHLDYYNFYYITIFSPFEGF